MHIFFAADNRSRLCTKTICLTFKNFTTMEKKQFELTQEQHQEIIEKNDYKVILWW